MAQVTIRPLKHGPYQVSGDVSLVDYEGAQYPRDEDPIFLCRCGRSANKPFCDGMHKKAGFQAEECVRMTADR
jgi:CDGSH-type Zn-finger protein